jgi:hypothetical protein
MADIHRRQEENVNDTQPLGVTPGPGRRAVLGGAAVLAGTATLGPAEALAAPSPRAAADHGAGLPGRE